MALKIPGEYGSSVEHTPEINPNLSPETTHEAFEQPAVQEHDSKVHEEIDAEAALGSLRHELAPEVEEAVDHEAIKMDKVSLQNMLVEFLNNHEKNPDWEEITESALRLGDS